MAEHGEQLKALQVGAFLKLEKIPAGGTLEARRLASQQVMFYWRKTRDGVPRREPIGVWDSLAAPKSLKPTGRGYSIPAALEAARELAKRDAETPGGLAAERERHAAALAAAVKAKEEQQKYTLKALCDEYVAWLQAGGKISWKDVQTHVKNHVVNAHPELAYKPASQVTKKELVNLLRALIEAGKKTTARKVRSYLRAAYSLALRADSDPDLPKVFEEFGIAANPVESIAPGKNRSDKDPLPLMQMRKYWQQLRREEGVIGAALRLHILTGGQRPAQLVRLRAATDLDDEKGVLKLLDPKGKREEPRLHLLPITPPVRRELNQLSQKGFMLSTDGGDTQMHPTSLSTWSQEVAERAGIPDFQLKRVRSGIETALAEHIPKHDRGQLQSHGIGGVQDEHYDAYEYLPHKRRAMMKLHQLLEPRATGKK